MKTYRNGVFTIGIQTKKRCPNGFSKIPEGFLLEIEEKLENSVFVNLGYLKKIVKLFDGLDSDKVKISMGQKDIPLHFEIKNKFKGVLAPIVIE